MPTATTIDDVLAQLDAIVAHSVAHRNPHGAFAALYRRVTAAVKGKLNQHYFDDDARMERLDVVFANRYLEAWEARQAGQPTTHAWEVAFDAAQDTDKLLLQHLLLGMNAHINLDLGVAAATICPGDRIHELEADFNRINELLLGLVDEVQDNIRGVSPLIGLLDRFFKEKDEQFAGFSLKATRLLAWQTAQRMAAIAPGPAQDAVIARADQRIALVGRQLAGPRGMLAWVVRLIGWFETSDVSAQIRAVSTSTR